MRKMVMNVAFCLPALLFVAPAFAGPIVGIQVTVTNLAPANGTYLAPAWIGFHDGTFDLFDAGSAASPAIESLAEDGDPGMISSNFAGSSAGSAQGILFGPTIPQIAPGESTSMVFNLDSMAATSRYLSFAEMVVPSNDAFISNDDPMAHPIFDASGNFVGGTFIVLGSMVWDAGTEVNTEAPMDTAFFGQMSPNTGPTEGGVVMIHPGYHAKGTGGILDDPMFANANFKAEGYRVAEISISQVPEPSAVILVLCGLAGLVLFRRFRTA